MPSVIDSPSGRVPEKASRWIVKEQRFAAAERFFLLALWGFPNICEFIEVELGQTESRGPHKATRCPLGHALLPCEASVRLLASSQSFQGFFCPEKNLQKVSWHLDFIWYRFSEKPKRSRKQQLALGTRLIG